MSETIGRRCWAIAEGYIPPSSSGTTRELTGHETLCILNATDTAARVVPCGHRAGDFGPDLLFHLCL